MVGQLLAHQSPIIEGGKGSGGPQLVGCYTDKWAVWFSEHVSAKEINLVLTRLKISMVVQ